MSRAVNTTISSQEPLQGSGGIIIAPFLVVIGGAWRFFFFFFFKGKDKIQLPFGFPRGCLIGPETQVLKLQSFPKMHSSSY